MIFYPFSTPKILTDAIFTVYGGHVGSTSTAQRQAAYVIAEEAVSEDIDTYLVPVTITGTYPYTPSIILDHAYIREIYAVRYNNFENETFLTVNGIGNTYVNLWDAERGILDVSSCGHVGHSHTHSIWQFPYQVQVVYETGLSSGTSYDPKILLGLTTYADIILNEIIGYGNEAPGDAGITSFSNQQYTEQRKFLLNTVYGNSPRANFVHKMLTKFRKNRYVAIR